MLFRSQRRDTRSAELKWWTRAAVIFIALGFASTNLADVAKAVGIDRNTLDYIKSKEELLEEVSDEGVVQTQARSRSATCPAAARTSSVD
ncbi:TetR family transcriptional regulator [Salinibacterium sp. ZJ454]|uniref:TetR family transcriptional regulator n=1 Tax=Salinibacterium sp. ZJ454 TaxID=2708339 RepID=UPI00141E330E|nr:TetR family transcriptional regulator [Salinibacterium sp. ZJ454]